MAIHHTMFIVGSFFLAFVRRRSGDVPRIIRATGIACNGPRLVVVVGATSLRPLAERPWQHGEDRRDGIRGSRARPAPRGVAGAPDFDGRSVIPPRVQLPKVLVLVASAETWRPVGRPTMSTPLLAAAPASARTSDRAP